MENVSQSGAAAGDTAGKRKVGRPRKSETGAVKRDPSAGSGVEEWRMDRSSTPYAPQNVAQNGAGNSYQTKKGKGPSRRPEEVVLIDSDTDEEEAVGGIPRINYEDMDDDTADVAAVAAAVAAKAAEEAALGCSTQRARDRPPKDSSPAGSVGSGGASSEWNGLV